MKLTTCVLFGLLALAVAMPAPRKADMQGLLSDLRDLVAGIKEELEVEMEKRDQTDEDMPAEEDMEAELEGELQEGKRQFGQGDRCRSYVTVCKIMKGKSDAQCQQDCENNVSLYN
ncbi:uncharacterized protein LOC144869447 isoform X1 [Branchiostoma floridae x Branchiostoma japonicum]